MTSCFEHAVEAVFQNQKPDATEDHAVQRFTAVEGKHGQEQAGRQAAFFLGCELIGEEVLLKRSIHLGVLHGYIQLEFEPVGGALKLEQAIANHVVEITAGMQQFHQVVTRISKANWPG